MRIRVLGACAGGGLPQWNCGGEPSTRARAGDPDVPPRMQPSLAVSADGERWSLLNASPDLRAQFNAFPGLHPRPGTRNVPLDSVVLTSAELDHTVGLLSLHETLSYRILSTRWVRDSILDENAAWRLLEPAWSALPLDRPMFLDRDEQLETRFFPVPGKLPDYLRGTARLDKETCVGLRITDVRSGKRLAFVPALKNMDPGTLAELAHADVRFVDGTFYSADELQAMRPGAPDAFALGHLPITGPGGSLTDLAELSGRSLYFHINGTNPVLDVQSPERAHVEACGIEIAEDGVEFAL
ncbi:MAG: pyrroloquinoline quinone biosynthesis protein PqqB [Deltaproteobacteria bacterium]|nr:pyrroloquinoline quinone biosynthesis protein PqqB [Deltaproteobacteria bacterium]MBW2360911.1 pyrroloquinoline quinone biosynthesis protein PqqB [Deltaproteobacteria bacterium]